MCRYSFLNVTVTVCGPCGVREVDANADKTKRNLILITSELLIIADEKMRNKGEVN